MAYNSVADIIGLIFIHLAVVASQSREITTKFDLTPVQGHRSWCQSKAHVRLPISHW